MRTLSLTAATFVAFLTGCAGTSMVPVDTRSGALTDTSGMTLYVFDKDVANSGKSACNGDCAVKWPPLIAAAGAGAGGDYGVISRDDGVRQWSFKGKPLYLWFKDLKPGDMSGDGVNNVWHVAKP